jgi:hypothetical protein
MNVKKWREVMQIDGLTIPEALGRDLSAYKNRWTTDQDIITDRLRKFPVKIIKRGSLPNGLPIGRLDRSCWKIQNEKIDCHALRPGYTNENWNKIRTALRENFDFDNSGSWIDQYVSDYVEKLF